MAMMSGWETSGGTHTVGSTHLSIQIIEVRITAAILIFIYNSFPPEFWDFTIDELAHYDLPAMLSAVLEETTEGDLMFVGHGLGSTAAMAMPHYRPDILDK